MPREARRQGATRLNLSLLVSTYEKLDKCSEMLESPSLAETIKRAINLLLFILESKRSGCKIVVIDRKGEEKEVEFIM